MKTVALVLAWDADGGNYTADFIFMEDEWLRYRRAMIAETERFIEQGLRDPDSVNWIPAKPVSRGGFPAKVASWFYRTVFFRD